MPTLDEMKANLSKYTGCRCPNDVFEFKTGKTGFPLSRNSEYVEIVQQIKTTVPGKPRGSNGPENPPVTLDSYVPLPLARVHRRLKAIGLQRVGEVYCELLSPYGPDARKTAPEEIPTRVFVESKLTRAAEGR